MVTFLEVTKNEETSFQLKKNAGDAVVSLANIYTFCKYSALQQFWRKMQTRM